MEESRREVMSGGGYEVVVIGLLGYWVIELLRRKPGILPNDWIGLAGRVANACPPWRGEWRINILSIKSRKTRRMALVMYD